MRKAIWCILLCLLIIAVFDPADKLTHLKSPLFVAVWSITLINYFRSRCPARIPLGLLAYVAVFSFIIPLTSICGYMLRDGSLNGYDGFQYFKAYLFLTLCIPLMQEKLSVVRLLSFVLTAQSALIIFVYTLTANNPVMTAAVADIGQTFDVIRLVNRTYGETRVYAVYFITSPLLVIPISYFTYQCIALKGRGRRISATLLVVNVAGMAMSGTRNNLIASIGTLLLVWFWFSRKKLRLALLAMLLLSAAAISEWGTIQGMLSPAQEGNAVKLQHLEDYIGLLSDPTTLLFGQGLGAPFNSTEYGYATITELTYLDLIRTYGILGATPMILCLFCPLWCLVSRGWETERYLYLAYVMYLYLCVANPLLVSSSGMLVLAIVLASAFSRPAGHLEREDYSALACSRNLELGCPS